MAVYCPLQITSIIALNTAEMTPPVPILLCLKKFNFTLIVNVCNREWKTAENFSVLNNGKVTSFLLNKESTHGLTRDMKFSLEKMDSMSGVWNNA